MERLIHLTTGDDVSNGITRGTRGQIARLDRGLKEKGIIKKGETVTYVPSFDPKLQAGTVGREVEVTQVFRDADDNVEAVTDRFSVDF
ncbi:MAG TPA: hypothetical protein VJ227_00275 [Patescibacteria group bacterium]|nr:hypothetical protein [Patescibacteria group bacterium]